MPIFEAATTYACAPATVFEFLSRPANLVLISPPELQIKLTDPPDRLSRGAVLNVAGRRWGLIQRIISEVTAFEPNWRIVEEQRQGPFRKLVHTRRLRSEGIGVHLTDHIEFEAPGGFIGLMLTPERIRKELDELYQFRSRKMKELLEPVQTG